MLRTLVRFTSFDLYARQKQNTNIGQRYSRAVGYSTRTDKQKRPYMSFRGLMAESF